MPQLTRKQKQWLVSAHVSTGALWFGTAVCMVVISLHHQNPTSGDELYLAQETIQILDEVVIVPAASLSLLTGGLLSWLTVWGFTKFYWVISKWVVTLALIIFGTFWLGQWTNAATAIAETERLKALQNPLFMFDSHSALIGGVIQTVCLLGIIAVSILKPWGRRDTKKAEKATAEA
ncbi:hypothetical protein IQ266_20265 [filamentous cyanobacterium LEGE 11480]|uniref:DUF2269 domain-containing protein n=1 Tax=Romeriopsis navalis LEGE 11480 TaxID=2777977 RepID=A0A928VT56_9CYAN|nr:hypothetical protein [Romeriopsis navalis]MBE9032077.1 hypothetical protein [Romeriopsis navalis LEGE 11480]